VIGLTFSATVSTNPNQSFHIYKTKLSYGNFVTPNVQLNGGVTLYQTESNFNAFDKSVMFNMDLTGRFYYKKFHADLGVHPGNYAEFIQNLPSRPKVIVYSSIGAGVTFPIAKKMTIDLEIRQLIAINQFTKYNGPNPFEAFFGLNYILEGSNTRFRRTKTIIRVSDIQTQGSHVVGYGFSAGAFRWPTDEGNRITYMNNSFTYHYILTKHWSLRGEILSTFLAGADSTVNGIDKKLFNTLNVGLGGRFNLGVFFAGANISVGSFSQFNSPSYADRNVRFHFNPEVGIQAKITKSVLLEFQTRYAVSLNHLVDKSDPSRGYVLGTLGVKMKLGGKK
jgi:hypothetical protein